jgi:hypothetical protein
VVNHIVQSAYRAYHSTETALLRVHHDISIALDKNCCAALLMLDLSAAFDMIHHNILQKRLEYSFGISGAALSWIPGKPTEHNHKDDLRSDDFQDDFQQLFQELLKQMAGLIQDDSFS